MRNYHYINGIKLLELNGIAWTVKVYKIEKRRGLKVKPLKVKKRKRKQKDGKGGNR